MNSFISVSVAFALFACIAAQVVPPNRYRFGPREFVPIVRQEYNLNPYDSSYNYFFETADGTRKEETGVLRNPGTNVEANSVQGTYSYVSDDGSPLTVNYIADENGFQPVGPHIHPSIVRAVEQQVAFARGQLPPAAYAPGQIPPGAFGRGQIPPGAFGRGQFPPSAFPQGQFNPVPQPPPPRF